MTEFDFSELDQAVSQAMSGSQPSRAESPIKRTPAKPRSRSRGQFMDIKHPSSRMKPPKPSSQTNRPETSKPFETKTFNQLAESQPIRDIVTAETTIEDLALMSEMEDSSETQPDELGDQPEYEVVIEAERARVENSEVASSPERPDDSEDDSEQAPHNSPFLPGVKPEKRPLGVPMPLADIPVLVPSGGLASEAAPEEESSLPSEPEKPPIKQKFKRSRAKKSAKADKQDKIRDSFAGSIPQQYRESEPTGDKSSNPIYDVETLQLASQHKRPSRVVAAVKITLWVIVLLAFGAGLSFAYYMFL